MADPTAREQRANATSASMLRWIAAALVVAVLAALAVVLLRSPGAADPEAADLDVIAATPAPRSGEGDDRPTSDTPVSTGTDCLADGTCRADGPSGPVCLSGTVVVTEPDSTVPIWAGMGPLTAERTGRSVIPSTFADPANDVFEVTIGAGDSTITGFVDPALAVPTDGPCESGERDEPLEITEASPNECSVDVAIGNRHFITNIGLDDPDGGLVAHTAAGIDEPITRVIPLDGAQVFPTGGCIEVASGSVWFEIASENGIEWVSSRYLGVAVSACLFGEQFGSRTPDSEPTDQIFGPIEGHAVRETSDGGAVRFAPIGSEIYRWYPVDAIAIGVPCFLDGPTGSVCMTGETVLIDLFSPEPVASLTGPLDGEATGRLYAPLESRGLAAEWVEVRISAGDRTLTGFVDPGRATVTYAPCEAGPTPNQADDLSSFPCTVTAATPGTAGGADGSEGSTADQFFDLRVSELDGCTRVVIDFAAAIGVDSPDRDVAVPRVEVTKTTTGTRIRPIGCPLPLVCDPPFHAAPGQTERVDFGIGTAIISFTSDQQPYVEVLHQAGRSAVTRLEEPGRIVVDIVPEPATTVSVTGPLIGESAILRRAIQPDLTGPGLAANTPVTVQGFARPFEASGQWVVLTKPTADGETTAIAEGLFSTTTWVAGWGEFSVDLPGLEPGEYLILFGEFPPTDGTGFVGSGQVVRVGFNADDGPFEPVELVSQIIVPDWNPPR